MKEEEEHQRELEKQHEENINIGACMDDDDEASSDDLNLDLDEDDPSQFFRSLEKFRKSFIEKRRQSGIHDLDDQTQYSAPPTEKNEEEYHRRIHTLDLDEKIDDINLPSHDPDSPTVSTGDNITGKGDEDIAPPHDSDHGATSRVRHAVEGSRELGIDDIGIINPVTDEDESKSLSYQDDLDAVNKDPDNAENKGSVLNEEMLKSVEKHGRSGSIKWAMSRDRESSKIFVSGAILNGSDDGSTNKARGRGTGTGTDADDKCIKKVSISKKNSIDGKGDEIQFDNDSEANGVDEFKDEFDDTEVMRLTDHFSVKRELQGPRGSMKVSTMSVSDYVDETLRHQTQIAASQVENVQNLRGGHGIPGPRLSSSSWT